LKTIDGTLYIEFQEMVDCMMLQGNKERINVEQYLRKAKSTGTKCWEFIADPKDRRKVLVNYEALKDCYKELIQKKFGNPYDYTARQPIKALVQKDFEAEKFFIQYSFDGAKRLPSEHINKYLTAASWLNMLLKMNEDKRQIKKQLGLSLEEFYTNVCDLIKSENIDLPFSYRRLRAKMQEYKEQGCGCLISTRFGNQNAAKVYDDHISSNLLLELLADPRQFDDVYIAIRYNEFAINNNLKSITDATVGVWRREKEYLILMQREGNSAFNEKYNRSIPGKRPSSPLYLVEHDDNHLDFLFIDENDKGSAKYFHKYKAIVVTDSYNDLVLGYAYAESLTTELVYAAYANAMHYIQTITGGYYLPFEVKSDRWQSKTLTPFYNKLGNYFDTPVGSKHRGYIEQFFRTPHWKRCQQLSSVGNWTGHNMTAKFRGVNMEHVDANMKNRPQIGHEAFTQIESFFYRLRNMPQNNGISKQQEWLNAFANLSDDKKRLINEEQLLYTIGIQHQPKNGSLPRINNEGLSLTINNADYLFTVPASLRMQYTGTPVSVLYDPFDMNRVLVTDNDKLRFVAYSQERSSKAMQDHYEGSRTYLNSMLGEKLTDVNTVVAAKEKRRASLIDSGIDAEALLLSNVVVKEIKQAADLHLSNTQKQIDNYHSDHDAWMKDHTDFSQYQ
jgi:hypothetical protein